MPCIVDTGTLGGKAPARSFRDRFIKTKVKKFLPRMSFGQKTQRRAFAGSGVSVHDHESTAV